MSELNLAYAGDMGSGPKHPWIQASKYKGLEVGDDVSLIIIEEALNLIEETEQSKIMPFVGSTTVRFGGKDSLAFEVKEGVRWVILNYPRNFRMNKQTKEVSHIQRGEKFGQTYKTISRVPLACLAGDELILGKDGLPQLFLLKLSGLKSNWISSKNESDRTIAKLNEGLCDHWNAGRKWLGHLVSVSLQAYPKVFEGQGDSSTGVMFGFGKDNARVLTEQQQALTFKLRNTQWFQDFCNDPFGISQSQGNEPAYTNAQAHDRSQGGGVPDLEDIPFNRFGDELSWGA